MYGFYELIGVVIKYSSPAASSYGITLSLPKNKTDVLDREKEE